MYSVALSNFVMHIGRSWLNSLKVFFPQNIGLFILVTINAWVKGLLTYTKNFWWLISIIVLIDLGLTTGFFGGTFFYVLLLSILLHSFNIFFIPLTIRPSISLKTIAYYLNYIYRLILFMGFYLLISIAFLFLIEGISYVIPIDDIYIAIISLSLVGYTSFYFSPLFFFIFYFYFDSDCSIKSLFLSLWRGIKMALYTYPFCLIITIVMVLVMHGGKLFYNHIINMIINRAPENILVISIDYLMRYSFFIIGFFFVGCLFNIVYLKRVHEDYELYFPNN